jgi:hypothetical protein
MSEVVDVAAFAKLFGNNWWKFKDIAGGGEATIECRELPGNRLQLKVNIPGRVSSHSIAVREVSSPGRTTREYTLLQSEIWGTNLTWGSGLVVPAAWQVGSSVSAVSNEQNPTTGQRVTLTATLKQLGNFKPPVGTPFPSNANLHGIEVELKAVSSGFVSHSATVTVFCVHAIGPVNVLGADSGQTIVLHFRGWSGGKQQ